MAIEWTFPLIIGIAALVVLGWGIMNRSTGGKKVDAKNAMWGGAAVLVLVMLFGGINIGGMFGGLTIIDGGDTDVDDSLHPTNGACLEKAYATLSVGTMVYGSNSYTTAAGDVDIFKSGVDPTGTNSNPIDTIDIASGVGNTTSGLLKSCVMYSVVFDGETTYYDAYWNDNSGEQMLPYVPTDSDTISTSFDFDEVITFATIDDPIDESAVTGVINGQTNVSGESTSTNELRVGSDDVPANGDTIYYNETNGDGLFYVDLSIGFSGGNQAVKDPVLCFVNDLTNPFEGNEFSSVTSQLRTGTDFGIPSSVTNYVNNMDCVGLGSFVDGGVSGTYRFTFTLDESLTTAGGDIMYIYIDDLGEHLGQDILRGTKATASSVVTIQTQD